MSSGDIRRDAALVLPVSPQGSLLCQWDLVMVELSSSKAPSPNLFPTQPKCDLGRKDWAKVVSASVAVIPTNFIYFPPYPAIPYSKWTSLPLGHLPLSSLGADSIPSKFPNLPPILMVEMKIDNGLIQKYKTSFETQINFTLWSVA